MNFCKRDEIKIDYLNGLLDQQTELQYRNHLEACPNCREELDGLSDLIGHVRQLPVPEIAPAQINAIKMQIPVNTATTKIGSLFTLLISRARQITIISFATTFSIFMAFSIFILFSIQSLSLEGFIKNVYGERLFSVLESMNRAYEGLGSVVGLLSLIIMMLSLFLLPSIIENLFLVSRMRQRDLKFFTF